jgi:hypothetical protein
MPGCSARVRPPLSAALMQPIAQGVADVGEDFGAGFAQLFFGGDGDFGNGVARLMVE